MVTHDQFEQLRSSYQPQVPPDLRDCALVDVISDAEPLMVDPEVKEDIQFSQLCEYGKLDFGKIESPKAGKSAQRVGVVLSGGPASGGHNVIAGLFDGLKEIMPENELIGFMGGPIGIVNNDAMAIDEKLVSYHRNLGGFSLLGTGRTKLETAEDFERAIETARHHQLNAFVICGGDDSNTNAALMAAYFSKHAPDIRVLGVPKTIDADLRGKHLPLTFGFDTAASVYSELVSNIARDVMSTQKYYHFIRLMGRSASHITLEVALRTKPNLAFISEEVLANEWCLDQLVEHLVGMIQERANRGKNYGIILIPEGLIEFIPEFRLLIKELNEILGGGESYFEGLEGFSRKSEFVNEKLGIESSYLFSRLPNDIQRQLLLARDQHGNVIVSSIETEQLLIEMVDRRLAEKKINSEFTGKFAVQSHFIGYEGRCAAPTNFDANYSYCLGKTAAILASSGYTAYMASVKNLHQDVEVWYPVGVPLLSMLKCEWRFGQRVKVISKSLVDLDSKSYRYLQREKDLWRTEDCYQFCGPIQYFGPKELTDQIPMTLTKDWQENETNINEARGGGL
jgi:diphosphate-dependent phosphofructokinase